MVAVSPKTDAVTEIREVLAGSDGTTHVTRTDAQVRAPHRRGRCPAPRLRGNSGPLLSCEQVTEIDERARLSPRVRVRTHIRTAEEAAELWSAQQADAQGVPSPGSDEGHRLDVQGVASLAWVGADGDFSGHVIEPHTSACFGLHGQGLSQAPDCTRDDDVQVLLVVVTDYRGHSASAVVRRRGGDLARLQTAHGELLLEGGKDVLAGTTPGIELEFQCESMKAGEEAERYTRRYLPGVAGKDVVINRGSMQLRGLPFPPL
eukprot:jgi/Tetstr1/456892/TSEL_043562.t1